MRMTRPALLTLSLALAACGSNEGLFDFRPDQPAPPSPGATAVPEGSTTAFMAARRFTPGAVPMTISTCSR